jgi:hypothetical protein
MDFAFRYLSPMTDKLWSLILLWGLAHATKPLGQLTMNLIAGWPFGSFRFGVLYPFASHLLVEMLGGVLAVSTLPGVRALSPKLKSQ